MKIISLNVFGGELFEPLLKYIQKNSKETDVFCFQEMLSCKDSKIKMLRHNWKQNLLQEFQKILSDFHTYFAPVRNLIHDIEIVGDSFTEAQIGNAIFYKKNLSITEQNHFFMNNHFNSFVWRDYSTNGHNMAYIIIETKTKPVIICNLHGIPIPRNKLDSSVRLEQSKKVLQFLENKEVSKIVVGDFNLFPETESIMMFKKEGFRNLIKEYDIKTTRGSIMRKLFPEYEHGKYGFQEFADYIFVTPDIQIQNFSVPDIAISDHLPMEMEILI